MKRKYYTGYEGASEQIYMVSVPLNKFNVDEMVKSYYNLKDEISLSKYTSDGFRKFYEEGFKESRVSAAPKVSDADSMVLFAYDENFKSPVGLSICFNGRFYTMDYSEGRRAESELFNIYTSKK